MREWGEIVRLKSGIERESEVREGEREIRKWIKRARYENEVRKWGERGNKSWVKKWGGEGVREKE